MPYSTQLHSCKDHSSTLLASCGAGTVAYNPTRLNYCGAKTKAVLLSNCGTEHEKKQR